MFKALTRLFAAETRAARPAAKAKLGLDALEGRDCPALLGGLGHVMLNPQPIPPKVLHTPVAAHVASPLATRGIIIVGGKVSLNPQPLPPRTPARRPGFGRFWSVAE